MRILLNFNSKGPNGPVVLILSNEMETAWSMKWQDEKSCWGTKHVEMESRFLMKTSLASNLGPGTIWISQKESIQDTHTPTLLDNKCPRGLVSKTVVEVYTSHQEQLFIWEIFADLVSKLGTQINGEMMANCVTQTVKVAIFQTKDFKCSHQSPPFWKVERSVLIFEIQGQTHVLCADFLFNSYFRFPLNCTMVSRWLIMERFAGVRVRFGVKGYSIVVRTKADNVGCGHLVRAIFTFGYQLHLSAVREWHCPLMDISEYCHMSWWHFRVLLCSKKEILQFDYRFLFTNASLIFRVE